MINIFFGYTKINLNILVLTITFVIFVLLNYGFQNISNAYSNIKDTINIEQNKNIKIDEQIVEEINQEIDNVEQEEIETEKIQEVQETKEENIIQVNNVWQLEIPKIELSAPISSGTTEDVMNKYIGHFENTSTWNGNIGLAAHNRRIYSKLF